MDDKEKDIKGQADGATDAPAGTGTEKKEAAPATESPEKTADAAELAAQNASGLTHVEGDVDIDDNVVDGHHIGGTYKELFLTNELKNSFLSYAMSVIVSRAIPDVRDGMKPVHRRIIYGMFELGVFPDKAHLKSARIVGDVMGRFHPHGDSAIYEAMVHMAQDFSYRYPLVDGHGNFGSIDGDPAAAMRYTEARMSKIAMEIVRDINKKTVLFTDNYDGSEKEPAVLPSKIPNLLINGATGIAVGMTTYIPPHNLGEVVDGLLALMANPDISIDALMSFIKGPDFPTGGSIVGVTQIRKAYMTGAAQLVVRGRTKIEKGANDKSQIIITEIPYMVNKTRLIERIADNVKEKKIDGIVGLQDESSMAGMRIVIDLRRDANPSVILNNLYKSTPLQSVYSVNMLALNHGQPEVMNLKEMLQYYLEHQIEVVTNRTKYDLEDAERQAEIIEGYIIVQDNLDQVVHIIRDSETTEEAAKRLMEAFPLSVAQTKAILDLPLKRLTKLEKMKFTDDLAALRAQIVDFRAILASPERKKKIIINELTDEKTRFADPRRTEITMGEDLDIEDDDLIPQEDVIITITDRGYVKRMSIDTYRAQNRGGKGLTATKMVEDDFVEHVLYTSSHDTLLFFSNLGKVYKMRAYNIQVGSRLSRGLPIVNLLHFEAGEKFAAVLNIKKGTPDTNYLIFATRQGLVKKTELSEFKNIRTNGIKAILLNDDDELFRVALTDGEKDLILGASNGKSIRFSESDIRAMGRISAGVRGIKLVAGEKLVGMAIVNTDGDEIMIVTENGFGKRTNVDAFRVQTRGGKGVKAMNITEKNGAMASLLTVIGDEDLMVITSNGMMIRTHLDQIKTVGRDTKGVKVIQLEEGTTVANIAIVPREEESEEAPEENEGIRLDLDYQFRDEKDQDDQNDDK